MRMTKDIERMLMSVNEMIENLEKDEAKALRKEMLQDFNVILNKVYSIMLPRMFKHLDSKSLSKKIEFCVNLEMKIATQKSTREIYQDIKMYQKAFNL